MATKVFRFRLAGLGINLDQLKAEINDPIAIVNDEAGGSIVDIQADEAVEDNVKDAAAEQGFEFVETDPASTANDTFFEAGPSGVFGGEFAEASDLATESTTSPNYQTKVQLVSGVLTGTFMVIGFFRVWTDGKHVGRHRLRNTTDSTDLSGIGALSLSDSEVRELKTVGSLVTFTGASKTFEIQWRDDAGGKTQFISDARLMLWKVSA